MRKAKTKPASDMEKPALTPGGWRPKSKITRLKPGQSLREEAGHLKVIETATGTVVKDLGPAVQTQPTQTEDEAEKPQRA